MFVGFVGFVEWFQTSAMMRNFGFFWNVPKLGMVSEYIPNMAMPQPLMLAWFLIGMLWNVGMVSE